jgi:hypothetical protein
MNVALLPLALLGMELTTPISDRMPELGVEAQCKARWDGYKLMNLPELESIADCVQDEKTAKQRLNTVWETTSRPVRERCVSEVLYSLGTRSYMDLLSCIEIVEDTKSMSPASALSGTSQRRNTK